ncbi:unnamed protein product, partial [Mesorhabditis spiculigera]
MSLGGLWAQSLLGYRGFPPPLNTITPSPVPSCSSEDSAHENINDWLKFQAFQPVWPSPDVLAAIQCLLALQSAGQPNYSPILTDSEPDELEIKPDPSLPKPIPLRAINLALFEETAICPDVTISRKRAGEKLEKLEKKEKRKKEDKAGDEISPEASTVPPPEELQKEADQLDETAAFVNVTEESRKAVAAIPNVIGECVCSLCRVKYDDVFRLAQHKCPRIAHQEYKCPEYSLALPIWHHIAAGTDLEIHLKYCHAMDANK